MTVARNVADVLADHVVFEVEYRREGAVLSQTDGV